MGDPVGCGYGSETEIVVSTLHTCFLAINLLKKSLKVQDSQDGGGDLMVSWSPGLSDGKR
jgi:hypothetical protein